MVASLEEAGRSFAEGPTRAGPVEQRQAASPFLSVREFAVRWQISVRTAHALIARRAVPHRKFSYTRRILIPLADLERSEEGAELEELQLPGGGRIVRPVDGDLSRSGEKSARNGVQRG
jgi:hypothetical protein